MRVRRALLGSAVVLVAALAGCTSSSNGNAPSPPAVPSTPPTSLPAAPTSAPASSGPSTTTDRPSALAAIRGAVLLGGPSPRRADAYRVTASGLARLTTGARLSSVTADRERIIVATANRISQLRGRTLHALGPASAFSPALSSSDALASVALDLSNQTPGITKPSAFVIGVQSAPGAEVRTVFRSASSLGQPLWLDDHTLIVAASNGTSTRIIRVSATTGASRTVATVDQPDALQLTAGSTWITAHQGARSTLVRIADGAAQPLGTGGVPLCWTGPDTLVAAEDSRIVLDSLSPAGVRTSVRTLTEVPDRRFYAADCSRVGR